MHIYISQIFIVARQCQYRCASQPPLKLLNGLFALINTFKLSGLLHQISYRCCDAKEILNEPVVVPY